MLEVVYGKNCKQRNQIFENLTERKICNCHSCVMTRTIRKLFEDPVKHQAWKDRASANVPKMQAGIKHRHVPPTGPTNPHWKGGRPKCQICGELCATYEATICKVCRRANMPKGEANPNWIGGKRECLDCGIPIKRVKQKRCSKCRYKAREGENHPMWKGGVTTPSQKARNTHEHRIWSRAVLERDRFTCQLCGFGGKRKVNPLHAHHKKRWADHKELRFDVDNGITLCRDCHLNIVHQGKWSNIPLDFWS